MRNKIDNEDGLTLIELIASMTILSIVILTFLAFFTNAFHFNTINSDSIQAMNIAREQKAIIWELQHSNTNEPLDTKLINKDYVADNGKYTKDEDNYHIEISYNPASENFYHKLYVVHVEIKKNGKLVSETYTYYEE